MSGGPCTPGSTTPLGGADLDSWLWWWSYNRDAYLDLERHVLDLGVRSGSDDFFLGEGMRNQQVAVLPDDATIRELIGPALVRALEEGGSGPRVEGTLLALAKLHPIYSPSSPTTLELLTSHVASPQRQLADAAVSGLGMTGSPRAALILLSLAQDTPSGQKLVDRESVPERTRALAALALAQLAARTDNPDLHRYVVHGLAPLLDESTAAPDLHVACVLAIGMSPLPQGSSVQPPPRGERRLTAAKSRAGQLHFLAGVLADDDRSEVVRAHVPRSLALLAEGADARHRDLALESLLAVLERRRSERRLVRQGAIDALGLIADADADALDVRAREVLHSVASDGQKVERGLALVALGLASSRPGDGDGEPLGALEEEREYLTRVFTRGKRTLKPWASLALGLQGHHAAQLGRDLSDEVGHGIEATFERTGSPRTASAHAIALGLRRDLDSGEELRARLASESDDTIRSQLAVAIGLFGEAGAVPALRRVLEDAESRPELFRDVSVALAMLGDKGVVTDLVGVLERGANVATMSTAVTALGLVGDARAAAPLLVLLEDESQQEHVRGFAAMALGEICESSPLPWKAAFTRHLNYGAMTSTLHGADGSGLLNLR